MKCVYCDNKKGTGGGRGGWANKRKPTEEITDVSGGVYVLRGGMSLQKGGNCCIRI